MTPRGKRRALSDGDRVSAAAETLLRISVLLEAGITPTAAWRHVADAGDGDAEGVADALREGASIPVALASLGGRYTDAGVAWQVATTVGAPLAPSLRAIARSLQDADRTRDDVRAALAEPAATARLVSFLPLIGIGLAFLLGLDPVAALGNPIVVIAVVAGAALTLTAFLWTRRLVERAQPAGDVAGLQSELVAVALSGGVSVRRALEVVSAAGGGEPDTSTQKTLDLSTRAGAPAVELLRSSAEFARHRARTEGRVAAGHLAARLLLPLGVCTLPAFLLIGVVPILMSILRPAVTVL